MVRAESAFPERHGFAGLRDAVLEPAFLEILQGLRLEVPRSPQVVVGGRRRAGRRRLRRGDAGGESASSIASAIRVTDLSMSRVSRGPRAAPSGGSSWLARRQELRLVELLRREVDETDAVVDVTEQLPESRLVGILSDGRRQLAAGIRVEAFTGRRARRARAPTGSPPSPLEARSASAARIRAASASARTSNSASWAGCPGASSVHR